MAQRNFFVYPFALPADVIALRGRLLSSAGIWSRNALGVEGEYARFVIKIGDRVLWRSDMFRLYEHKAPFIVPVPFRNGVRVYLEYYSFTRNHYIYLHSYTRYPFSFSFRKRIRPVPVAVVKPPRNKNDHRQTILKARLRANRSLKPSARLRDWTPRSQKSPSSNSLYRFDTRRWNAGVLASTTPYNVNRLSHVASGTVTSGYISKKRSGTLPQNPYSLEEVRVEDNGAYEEYVDPTNPSNDNCIVGSYSQRLGGNPWGPNIPLAAFDNASVDARAISSLIASAGQGVNNLAQDIAQINQTTSMIANAAQRIAGSILAVKKGNLPKAISTLWQSSKPRFNPKFRPSLARSTADNWLALQYGWKPLLQDIDGAMDSLARYKVANRSVQVARSSAKKELVEVTQLQVLKPGDSGTITSLTTWSTRYGIRYSVDDHLSTFLNQTGFTNPINLAWEVLPYSFVVDWFIPIGPYLEALTAWDGLKFVSGWKSQLVRKITYWDCSYSGPANSTPGTPIMFNAVGSMRREHVKYVRSALSTFPSQRIPTFKNPISVTHASNALALLVSAFHK